MRSIRFTEKTLTRALTAGVLMGSLFLPFSAGAASPERTAESKSVPAATVSAQEKVSQEKIVKENLKIAGTALMCAGTYSMGEGSSEHSLFSDYGWDVSPFRAASDDTDVHFAVAVSKKAYGRTYPTILAFRGSQTKTDWKTNFRASLVPFDEKNKTADPKTVPSVHEGFERYAATVLRTPMDLDGDGKEEMVAPYLKQHPDRRLYLTGHSLGGAVASLVAERLVEKGVPKAQVPVITFGAPAVGNKAFADVYGKRIDLIRVVTSLDPVPGSLQTFFGGDFTQFGKVVKFNLSKNYSGYQHPVPFSPEDVMLPLRKDGSPAKSISAVPLLAVTAPVISTTPEVFLLISMRPFPSPDAWALTAVPPSFSFVMIVLSMPLISIWPPVKEWCAFVCTIA